MDKGLKILMETYWNGGRWEHKAPASENLEQAKREGYMFGPAEILTHDETLRRLRCCVDRISPTDVANAFVYSLSTRALQYRSALGSYYYAAAIPDHTQDDLGACSLCSWMALCEASEPEKELAGNNIFQFERYKWGGVRHTSPGYALFDLEQFLLLPKVTPAAEDWDILRAILHTMEELPAGKKAGAYRELITKKKLLKSNKSEVGILLNLLGICGVLSGKAAPCYCDCFAGVRQRAPLEHNNDYAYPVNRWYVSDGVNEERFQKVFGFNYRDL